MPCPTGVKRPVSEAFKEVREVNCGSTAATGPIPVSLNPLLETFNDRNCVRMGKFGVSAIMPAAWMPQDGISSC